MPSENLEHLSPQAQEQYLSMLLQRLDPETKRATMTVVHWLKTEKPVSDQVAPAQVIRWIQDVATANYAREARSSAAILPFRRMQ